MNKDLQKGHTVIVKGPSRITLLEGKVEIIGKPISPVKGEIMDFGIDDKNAIIIPSAITYPIYAVETSKLDVYTNSEDNLKFIEENSIPTKWIEVKDSILEKIKKNKGKPPLTIMLLGISSGKTTLIKYLANNFLAAGLQGGYLDSDLGQQIMYLPTTINIGKINDYVVSSEQIPPEDTVFIGATFPKGNYKFIMSHYSRNLIDIYIAKHKEADFVLIDSDGWIRTDVGKVYKNFFIKKVDPDVLIVFHDESIEELKEIEETAAQRKDRKIFLIEEKNKYYYEKDKEERRFLRQSLFAKAFESFRKMTIPLDDIKFIKTDFDIEKDKVIEVYIKRDDLIKLPYHYVIIALLTEDSKLVKIGLLFQINVEKDYILLFSDINYRQQLSVKKILLGSLRLSTKGNHQGYLYL